MQSPHYTIFKSEPAARDFYWKQVAIYGSLRVSLPTWQEHTNSWKVSFFTNSEKQVDTGVQSATIHPVGPSPMPNSLGYNRGVTKMNETQVAHDEAAAKAAHDAHHETVAKLLGIPKPRFSMREHVFRFRTPRDEKGKPAVDELGNPVPKRPEVKLQIPVPTFEGVVAALEDEKQRDFILSLIEERIDVAAREQVSDESKPVNKQDELDVSKLTLKALAELPPAERRGGGIAGETWKLFSQDYAEIMPGITGKDAEKIGNAIKIFLARLQPAKTNKVVLKALKDQLNLWFSNSANGEELAEVYKFLSEKADEFLAMDEKALLANL